MKKLILGALAACALVVTGCRGDRDAGEQREQPGASQPRQGDEVRVEQGAVQIDDAEKVDPHTMGGTGGAGTEPSTPPDDAAVGVGGGQLDEPALQDDENLQPQQGGAQQPAAQPQGEQPAPQQ